MNTTTINVAVHPWEILKEFIDWLWVSQRSFAGLIGKKQAEVSYIINGVRNINADWAIRLSIAFKNSPEFWLGMQYDYDLYMLNKSKKQEEYSEIAYNLSNFWVA